MTAIIPLIKKKQSKPQLVLVVISKISWQRGAQNEKAQQAEKQKVI
jgi:hypothetical protein